MRVIEGGHTDLLTLVSDASKELRWAANMWRSLTSVVDEEDGEETPRELRERQARCRALADELDLVYRRVLSRLGAPLGGDELRRLAEAALEEDDSVVRSHPSRAGFGESAPDAS